MWTAHWLSPSVPPAAAEDADVGVVGTDLSSSLDLGLLNAHRHVLCTFKVGPRKVWAVPGVLSVGSW